MCALLTKPERRTVDLPARYIGFEIPDKFAIGYGLDHAERYPQPAVRRRVICHITGGAQLLRLKAASVSVEVAL